MCILTYDGSFEGLLTCVYDGFYLKRKINNIFSEADNYMPSLFDEVINVVTDINKFEKVRNAVINKIDRLSLKKVYTTYLSNANNKELLIYNYLKKAFKIGHDIHLFLNIDEVRLIDEISKRVSYEVHLLRGFIRFNYIQNKFLYAAISPDNDILEFLAESFKKRYSNEFWIINDTTRKKAIIYNKESYEIIPFCEEDTAKLYNYKDEYSQLWIEYFKATHISERKNLKLQRRMMPKRYWKNIFETHY